MFFVYSIKNRSVNIIRKCYYFGNVNDIFAKKLSVYIKDKKNLLFFFKMSKSRLASQNTQQDDEFSLLEASVNQMNVDEDHEPHSPSKNPEVRGAFIGKNIHNSHNNIVLFTVSYFFLISLIMMILDCFLFCRKF